MVIDCGLWGGAALMKCPSCCHENREGANAAKLFRVCANKRLLVFDDPAVASDVFSIFDILDERSAL